MSNADADDTNPNGSGDDAGRTLSQAPSQDEADVVRRTLSDVSPSYLGGAYGRTDVDPGPAAPPPPSRLRAAHNRNAEYSTPHPQVRYTGQLGGSPPAAYHEPRAAYAADSGPPQLPLRAFPEADPSKPMLGGGRSPTPASCMSASYVSVDDAKVAQQVMDIKKSALLRLSLASARAGRSYGAAAAASEYPYAAPGAGHSTPFESASSRGSERREPSQRAQAPPLRAAPSEAHAAYLRSLPRRPAPTQASGAFTHRVSDVQPSAGTAWPPPPPQVQQPTKPAGLHVTSSPLMPYSSQSLKASESAHSHSVPRPRAGLPLYASDGTQLQSLAVPAAQHVTPGRPRHAAQAPEPRDGSEVRWKRVVERDQHGELVESVRWIREIVEDP